MNEKLKILKEKIVNNILQSTDLKNIIENEIDKLFFQLQSQNFIHFDNTEITEEMNEQPWKYLTHYTSGCFNAYMKVNNLWFYFDIQCKIWKKSSILNTYLEKSLLTALKDKGKYKQNFKYLKGTSKCHKLNKTLI